MPIKITPATKTWPCIDINTYLTGRTDIAGIENHTFIPDQQLRSGHVHHFDMPTEAILPLRPVHFFGEHTYTPNDVDVVLTTLWGPRWPIDCMVTYNHRDSVIFFNGSFPGIENPEANKHIKVTFPCKFMPKAYHGEFIDGHGLERFGFQRSRELPPPTERVKALLEQALDNFEKQTAFK